MKQFHDLMCINIKSYLSNSLVRKMKAIIMPPRPYFLKMTKKGCPDFSCKLVWNSFHHKLILPWKLCVIYRYTIKLKERIMMKYICWDILIWTVNFLSFCLKLRKMFIFNLQYFCKGRRPYPFCHAKRESDVLGGWVGKIYLSRRFVWQSGSKEDMGSSKEKI